MHYFYHGIEIYYPALVEQLEIFLKILNEGIITRNQAGHYNDSDFEHVCLFRKVDDIDYSKRGRILSALDAWIENGLVIIVNNNLPAERIDPKVCNCSDEWRYYGNIPPSEFVGIAIPSGLLNDFVRRTSKYDDLYDEVCRAIQLYDQILAKAEEMHLPIYDSSQPDFTDVVDATLLDQPGHGL